MTCWGAAFERQKYLNLETFRRSGEGVRTPIWVAAAPDGTLYVYTLMESGKVKRIRRASQVRIAPCDMRGNVTGAWFEATARLVSGAEFDKGMALINRKYRPTKLLLLDLGSLLSRRERAVIALSAR
jgi:PPOX class probable F420-dependent enzyme